MNLHHHSFGYYLPTSLEVRANKMDWTKAVNRPMPVGLLRFVQEDEP